MAKCVFLLTGDFHGRLPDASAEIIRGLRGREENALLLDAGDAVEAGNLGPGRSDSPILAKMSAVGYDAMALGNRESHPLRKLLARKLAAAKFPVLSANMMAKRQPPPPQVKEFLLRQLANGVRVAIIGLTVPITAPQSWWSKVTDYVFDAPEKTAAGLVAKLRGQADLVVILSHCGIQSDRKLAGIAGVDLVLGGHSHVELFETGEGAPIFHSGYLGRKLGRVEVRWENGKVVKIESELLPLSEPQPRRRGRS